MTRAPVVRAVLALALLVLSGWVVLTQPPRLGLDLRGGTQIVLQTLSTPTVTADAAATGRVLEVLRERVDALGVAEPTLARSGQQRIIVELPGLQDPVEAAEVLGRTAQLAIHPVIGVGYPSGDPTSAGGRSVPDESGVPLRLGPVAIAGEDVSGARAQPAQGGIGSVVAVTFAGADSWRQLTARAACAAAGEPARRIAIVLDDRVISSPQLDPSIGCGVGIVGGSTEISGQFSREQARELAVLIEGGALPVPVEIIEQRTVGPTLGKEAIAASAQAAAIGVALTGVFLLAVYRLVGLAAVLGLGGYALVSYAALTGLGATLTLPGLAGFVLAIGMAVDANVLVAERAREEYGRHPGRLQRATDKGFRAALPAIGDSAVTTLLAAALLFGLASGPVRGFGVTLIIGVVVSLFSALVLSRVITEWVVRRGPVRRRPQVSGIASVGPVRRRLESANPELLRRRRRWLAASAMVVLVAGAGVLVRGLELGVEFTGGRLIEYVTARPLDPEAARQAVADAGFPRAVVQSSGDGGISVRAGAVTDTEAALIREAIATSAGGAQVLRDELIGPSLGEELRRGALIALGVALAAQLIYLAVRFRWTFSAGAVAALVANVAVVVGSFAWLGRPLDGVFLAALLTVIGYSVNDSVVVFDRVREVWSGRPAGSRRPPFYRVVGRAVLSTLPRTINTGLSTMVILAALLFLGGDSLADFALALLIGIVAGTASTISVAAPLTIELENRCPSTPTRRPDRARMDRGAVV
ncbi:protein translocase subunit SecD [Pseudonocardia sp. Cha107L01]|uniref:protein translocase subunit SecD n=1 Tax=Pseudonocardia sp. Cha107L01 TaxID=3457576 RepID=UPI00403E6CA1